MRDFPCDFPRIYIGLSLFVPFAVLHGSVFQSLSVSAPVCLPSSLCVSLSAPWPLLTSICLSFFSVSCSPACCRLAGPALGRLSAGPLGSSLALCRPALRLSWGRVRCGHRGRPAFSSSVRSSETEYNHLGSDSKPLPGAAWGPGWTIAHPPGSWAACDTGMSSQVTVQFSVKKAGLSQSQANLLQGLVRLRLGSELVPRQAIGTGNDADIWLAVILTFKGYPRASCPVITI